MFQSSSVFVLAPASLKNSIYFSGPLKYMRKLIHFHSANIYVESYKTGFCTWITCRDRQSHQRAKVGMEETVICNFMHAGRLVCKHIRVFCFLVPNKLGATFEWIYSI